MRIKINDYGADHGRIQNHDNGILVINVFHKGPCEPPSRSNWTQERSVQVLLRKPIATCDYLGGPLPNPPLWQRPAEETIVSADEIAY